MTNTTYTTSRPFFQQEISSLKQKAAAYNLSLTPEQQHNPELLAKAVHSHEKEMIFLMLRTTKLALQSRSV